MDHSMTITVCQRIHLVTVQRKQSEFRKGRKGKENVFGDVVEVQYEVLQFSKPLQADRRTDNSTIIIAQKHCHLAQALER